MVKRLLLGAALVLLLVGCDDTAAGEDHDWWVEDADVHGRQIPCVFWIDHSTYKIGGMSCDWSPQ